MKKVVSMLLMVAMVFTLVACGSKGPAEVGVYSIESIEAEGMKMDRAMLDGLMALGGESIDLDSLFKLEMKADGSFVMESEGEASEGTYADGKMTVDGESVPYTYSDGILTLEADGAKMSFKKK